jgi:hypothetical protein
LKLWFGGPLKNGTGSEHLSANPVKNTHCEVPVPLFQRAVSHTPAALVSVASLGNQHRFVDVRIAKLIVSIRGAAVN